jgi:nucleoside-diphosphate-sugar epimerase
MIAKEGHFVAPIGDARVSAVDVRDIAAVAAIALAEPGHEGKTHTIIGPAAVTHTEMAGALPEHVARSLRLRRRHAVAGVIEHDIHIAERKRLARCPEDLFCVSDVQRQQDNVPHACKVLLLRWGSHGGDHGPPSRRE